MVDDVLEILIKNGELPPSAAQDPATPTTPNRQLQQNLVFTAPADSPIQSLVFTAASPMSPISPIPMEVSHSGCPSPSTPTPPPPPPPLPLTTFSIQLPSALQQLQQQEEISSFGTDLLTSEAELDTAMLLSPQSTQQASPDPQPPQEVTSSDNANLDLKVHSKIKLISRGSKKIKYHDNYIYIFFLGAWIGLGNIGSDGLLPAGLRHADGYGRSRLAGLIDAAIAADHINVVQLSIRHPDLVRRGHLRPAVRRTQQRILS